MQKQFLTIILIFIFGGVFSQTHSLTLEIKGCDTSGGKLMIAGFRGAKDFNNKENSAFNEMAKVKEETVEVNLYNVKNGEYAIAIYHDQNSDNELNVNQLGIPIEGFGFSGNYSVFKRPRFKDCSFTINSDTTIIINMHYLWN